MSEKRKNQEKGNQREGKRKKREGRENKSGEQQQVASEDELEFEDAFEDDYIDEMDDPDVEVMVADEEEEQEDGGIDAMQQDQLMCEQEEEEEKVVPWIPGVDPLQQDEELDYDSSAYKMLHRFMLEAPCLSFDIIRDQLGGSRSKFPHTTYLACGTQSAVKTQNALVVAKIADMHKTQYDSDAEDGEDDDEWVDEDPTLEYRDIPMTSAINKVRSMPQKPELLASFAEDGRVRVHDVSSILKLLDGGMSLPTKAAIQSGDKKDKKKPLLSHQLPEEGWALDWCKAHQGRLLAGTNGGQIVMWDPTESGWIESGTFAGHASNRSTVEDIQWSPDQATVFASCGTDKTIRIWDIRQKHKECLCQSNAHDGDVNCISWNSLSSECLLSGGEDGVFRSWDLNAFPGRPSAHYKYHRGPITSLEWHPTDNTTLAVSSMDNIVSLWDQALELDEDASTDLPPQLLFLHQGMTDPKEIHWHPQIPGLLVVTSADGFNVFMTINSN